MTQDLRDVRVGGCPQCGAAIHYLYRCEHQGGIMNLENLQASTKIDLEDLAFHLSKVSDHLILARNTLLLNKHAADKVDEMRSQIINWELQVSQQIGVKKDV